ncbi:MAG: site-specific DNA-methyltransferase, partial [Ignavibacteria bacterium]|nr:site-specific DNA-methyltransferase [Ignavibacteria bacterium]
FDDLDKSLDGWLIKSENYQALNSILPKFKEQVQSIFIDPPFNKAESEQFSYIANYLDSSWITMLENRLKLAKEILARNGTIFVNSDDKCNSYTRFLLDQIFVNFQNEIIWCYEKPGAGLGKFKNNHADIYLYSKSEEFLFNTLYVPRKGETELTKRDGKHNVDYEGKISPDWWVDMWTEIPSFATAMTAGERAIKMLGVSFPTQIPEKLLYRVLFTGSNKNDLVMDFFAGTGVTGAVAHKMNRKWISVELGEQFNTIVLPRMKKVLAYDKSGISKDIPNYSGGGFFKYYELEQYEDALKNCKYGAGDLFSKTSEKAYQDYVFMKDEKMLSVLEIDYKNKKVKVDLSKLYPDIDIAETLSNLTGKWIKAIK